MSYPFAGVLLAAFVLGSPSWGAGKARGVALVVGNQAYPSAPLRNPVNDARSVAATLRNKGYQVMLATDVDYRDLKRKITAFGQALRGAEMGLFYYSGHGIQYKGKNYLIPVDAKIGSEEEIAVEGVDSGYLLTKMAEAKAQVNVVILDACRSNPFERGWGSVSAGLAVMDAPAGSLIAYSTAPGQVALDGGARGSKHSVYTEALIEAMALEDVGLETLFKRVRRRVRETTAGKQIPWESTSLEGEVVLRPGGSLRHKLNQFGGQLGGVWPSLSAAQVQLEPVRLDPGRAQETCSYDELGQVWRCDPQGLQNYPVLYSGHHSTAAELKFTPVADDKCVRGVELTLRDPNRDLVVNWDLASFVVNGETRPVRATLGASDVRGFARTSNVQANTWIHATLTLDDAGCALQAPKLDDANIASLDVVVPFLASGRRQKALWRAEWRFQPVTARQVMRMIPEPPRPKVLKDPGSWWPVLSLSAGALALSVAVAAGTVIGATWLPPSNQDLANNFAAGAGYGSCVFAGLLLPSLPVTIIVDMLASAAHEKDVERYRHNAKIRQKHDSYRLALGALEP